MTDQQAHKTAVLIAGPTASGKSSLAMAIAEHVGGTIVNCDSMQVYADLQTLTARPTTADMTQVPHALYGHVDAPDAYSAGRYVRETTRLLKSAGTPAGPELPLIFVGGTGLYFNALLDGLSPIPAIPDAIRARWRTVALELPNTRLHAQLAERDPVMAGRLPVGDTQRIVRALEVIDASGTSLSDWQRQKGDAPLTDWRIAKYVLNGNRAALYDRADTRFAQMIEAGAVDEVRALIARDLSDTLPIMRAVGVRPIVRFLRSEISLDTAIAYAQQDTRRYIKRQTTWLSRYMSQWNNVHISECDQISQKIIPEIVLRLDARGAGS